MTSILQDVDRFLRIAQTDELRILRDMTEKELSRRNEAPAFSNAQTVSGGAQAGAYREEARESVKSVAMHTFATGAKRSERMPRYDLVVQDLVRRIAERATGEETPNGPSGGALKYGEGNWERGLPTSDVFNHIIHHLGLLQEDFRDALSIASRYDGREPWPLRMDAVRNRINAFLAEDDHIGAVGWGLMVLCHQLKTGFYHDTKFEKDTEVTQAPTAEEAIPPTKSRKR